MISYLNPKAKGSLLTISLRIKETRTRTIDYLLLRNLPLVSNIWTGKKKAKTMKKKEETKKEEAQKTTVQLISKVQMERVDSSAIKEIGYIDSINVLIVKWKSGVLYEYDVPKSVYRQFFASASKGRFFNKTIRPKYSYRKLTF